MLAQDQHAMLPKTNHDEAARQAFVVDFRMLLASKVLPGNFSVYHKRVEPAFVRENGRKPKNRHEARKALEKDEYHQLWSAMQRASQEMVWDSVIDSIERQLPKLVGKANAITGIGSLTLDPNLEIPRYLTAADIHLMPGGYHVDQMRDDITAGALYDRGVFIYSMGAFGKQLDMLGQSNLALYKKEFQEKAPVKILDMGCGIGNSTIPWAREYPEVEIHAIDVAAPGLRYGHARAESLGVPVHFSQQNAERTIFPDDSFDLIVSHIMLHETSRSALNNIFAESFRLLKPDGFMLHLDLPRAGDGPLARQAVREWEIHNNNEHFYGQLLDIDLEDVAVKAGFEKEKVRMVELENFFSEKQSPYTEGGSLILCTTAQK